MDQDPGLNAYRTKLIETEQVSQEQYDKTVLALSGGAFGISFAFVDKFVEGAFQGGGFLLAAWVAWGLSITAVLFSFYFSTLALRMTIVQLDEDPDSLYSDTPGGVYTKVVATLNAIGGVLFLIGALLLIVFVANNI